MIGKALPCKTFARSVLLAGAVAGFAPLAQSPAQAETLNAAYSVRLLGLSLGTAGLVGTVGSGSYRLEASAKLSGIAAAVTKSEGAATASGVISKGRLLPATYASASSNSKETRTVRMAISAGNVSAAEVTPPAQQFPDSVPVTDAQKRGIIDPLSAILMPVATSGPLVGPEACARNIPVYDGVTRFDIPLSYVGTRHVSAQGYDGLVAVCSARYRPIAGHRPNREQTRFMAENKQMEIWMAPLPEARALAPFRISVGTMVGTLVIEATRFQTAPSTTASTR